MYQFIYQPRQDGVAEHVSVILRRAPREKGAKGYLADAEKVQSNTIMSRLDSSLNIKVAVLLL